MGFILYIAIGILAGFLAGKLMRGSGLGLRASAFARMGLNQGIRSFFEKNGRPPRAARFFYAYFNDKTSDKFDRLSRNRVV